MMNHPLLSKSFLLNRESHRNAYVCINRLFTVFLDLTGSFHVGWSLL